MLARLGLVVFGIVAGLVAAEIALQLAAAVVFLAGHHDFQTWTMGGRHVLALGDSNTYGILVEPQQTYPSQLQLRWNRQAGVRPINVVNMGYPGNNSSQIRRDLPRLVEQLHPDVVLVLVGANDFWTAPVPVGDSSDESGSDGIAARLARASRVVRLLRMLGRAVWTRPPLVRAPGSSPGTWPEHGGGVVTYGDITLDFSWTRREVPDWAQQLRGNLTAIISYARASGVTPVLLTYASEGQIYGLANVVIRDVARANGVRLVDVGGVFRAACLDLACTLLLFSDGHPNAKGYRIVARTVMSEISDILGQDAQR